MASWSGDERLTADRFRIQFPYSSLASPPTNDHSQSNLLFPLTTHPPPSCNHLNTSYYAGNSNIAIPTLFGFHLPDSAFHKFADICKPQTSGRETVSARTNANSQVKLEPESPTPRKHKCKSKVMKHGKSGARNSNAESVDGFNPTTVCRYDSSLGLLTKRFIKLLQEDGILDLNKTAKVLEVQKRRIYDITNVLEGVGLIEKTSKNHIRWKDGIGQKESDLQVSKLKAEVESLYTEEYKLENSIREMQELLKHLEENEEYQKHLFLTEEDISSLPCFQNRTLIAIKAPRASNIEVPDPEEDTGYPQYKMIIRSTTGPIDLYLLSKHQQGKVAAASQVNPTQQLGKPCCQPTWEHAKIPLDYHCDSSETFISYSGASGVQKIVPSNCDVNDDYWFRTGSEVSNSELWG